VTIGNIVTTSETCRVTGVEVTTWETDMTIEAIKKAIVEDGTHLDDVTAEHIMTWLCDNVIPTGSRFVPDEVHDREVVGISETATGNPSNRT